MEEVEATPKKSKKIIFPIILALIVIVGGYYAINTYLYTLAHENTDDAQLETDISPVSPRISGYVTDVLVLDNQKVKAGQVLIKLDTRDLQIKIQQAQAALDNAQANIGAIKANTVSYEAAIATAQANVDNTNVKVSKAKSDLDRYSKLFADKSISQQQYDDIKAAYDNSQTSLKVMLKQQNAADEQYKAALQQVSVAQSTIAQRQADLDFAKLQLSYATITAPASGEISKKNVEPGQFIQAGQQLFAVVSDSDLWAVGNFKETQLGDMKVGQTATITVDAFKDKPITGVVNSISGGTGARFALLPPDNSTGNFVKVVQRVPVKVLLKLDNDLKERLRPGMSIDIEVNTK